MLKISKLAEVCTLRVLVEICVHATDACRKWGTSMAQNIKINCCRMPLLHDAYAWKQSLMAAKVSSNLVSLYFWNKFENSKCLPFFGKGNLFWKLWVVYLYTFWVENFAKITLEVILCFCIYVTEKPWRPPKMHLPCGFVLVIEKINRKHKPCISSTDKGACPLN